MASTTDGQFARRKISSNAASSPAARLASSALGQAVARANIGAGLPTFRLHRSANRAADLLKAKQAERADQRATAILELRQLDSNWPCLASTPASLC